MRTLAFHSPVQGYTQAQLDKAVEYGKALIQSKLDDAQKTIADLKNAAPAAPVVIHDPPTTEELAKATGPLNAKIAGLQTALEDMTRQKDAASQIAPVSVEKLPTTLRLLFKGNDIEEIEARNVIWAKIIALHEEKITTLLGERSNTIPVWAIVLIFKKPITFKKIQADNHGAGLPMPELASSSPRYAIIEFNSSYSYFQNVLVDITIK
jgi:hypothetical protein